MSQEKQRIIEELVLLQTEILTEYIQKNSSELAGILENTHIFIEGLTQALKNDFIVVFAHNVAELKSKNADLLKQNQALQMKNQTATKEFEANLRTVLLEKNEILTEFELLKKREEFLQERFGSESVQARIEDFISKAKHLEAANITKDSYIVSKQLEIKTLIDREIELTRAVTELHQQNQKYSKMQTKLTKEVEEMKVLNKQNSETNEDLRKNLEVFKEKLNGTLKQATKSDEGKKILQKQSQQLRTVVEKQSKQLKNMSNIIEQNQYLRETILNLKEYIAELKETEEKLSLALQKNESIVIQLKERQKTMQEQSFFKQQEFLQTIEELHQTCRQFQKQLTKSEEANNIQKKNYQQKIQLMLEKIQEQEKKLNYEIIKIEQEKHNLEQINQQLQNTVKSNASQIEQLKGNCQYLKEENSQIQKQLARKIQKFAESKGQKWIHRKSLFVLYELAENIQRLKEENISMKITFQRNLQSYLKSSKKEFFNGVQQILALKEKCETCEHWSKYLRQKKNVKDWQPDDPEKYETVPRLKPRTKNDRKRMKKTLNLLTAQNQQAGHRIESLIKQL